MKTSSWPVVLGPFSSISRVLSVGRLPLRATQAPACHSERSARDDILRAFLISLLKSKIRNSRLILGVAWTVMLMGCAAQGPPRPPRVQVPQRVTDLVVHQVGRSLELGFTPPVLATDGENLTKPVEVEIFREITPPSTKPSQEPGTDPDSAAPALTPGSPWVTLGPADLTRLAFGKIVVYVEGVSDQQFPSLVGSTFGYKVRALTRGFRRRALLGAVSNRAAVTLLDVSGPVQNLKVVTTEKALRSSWETRTRTLTGAPVAHLTGYRVYRSETPKLGSFKAVGDSKEAAFADPHFEFGRTYRYKVRAVFKQGAQEAEGEDSQPCEVTPRDAFPPAAPQGLTALYTVGAVDLVWNANLEPDLAGYTVYRREEGRPFQPINKEMLKTPLYRDSSIEPQRHYFYEVTAVDRNGNESKPSAEAQADTE